MIFTQVSIELQKTIKKKTGAEKNTVELITLMAKQERISQTRLDEFSMQGLKKVVRYALNNIGDYEFEIFDYFQDERGTRYKRTVWERDTKTNKIILEGVVANGNYSDFIVQYVNKARKKTATGVVDGYKINVYPSLKATADAGGESETDSSDGVDPIQYTLPVSASGTPAYRSQGKTPASVSYEVWGDQAIEFEKMMNSGLFIMFPDTVIPAKALGV